MRYLSTTNVGLAIVAVALFVAAAAVPHVPSALWLVAVVLGMAAVWDVLAVRTDAELAQSERSDAIPTR